MNTTGRRGAVATACGPVHAGNHPSGRIHPDTHAAPARDNVSWPLVVLLFAATFAVYIPALHGALLLDDDLHVTRPGLRSLSGLGRMWFEVGATQQYYPVLHSAFWLEHRLWGDAVFGYHLVNILLHATAACLVAGIMRRLMLPGAWLAAFVFALHPVAVESVAWISEQKNTLSTVLCLASIYVYLRFDDERRWSAYILASTLGLLALLSKTATAVLPAALIVLLWWRRSRPKSTRMVEPRSSGDSPRPAEPAVPPSWSWRRNVLPLVPWFATAIAIGLLTLRVERTLIERIGADLSLSWLERSLVASRALWFYFLNVLWPANLSFFYERWPLRTSDPLAWRYLLAVTSAAAILLLRARRGRGALVSLLIFAGTLAPVLGFVDVEWFVFSFVADHFQYLANVAVMVPAAAVMASLAGSASARVAFVALVIALAGLTWRHSSAFRDNVTLYTKAVALSPGSAVAHNHLGAALALVSGREADAIRELGMAMQLNPQAADVHENLGELLLRVPGRWTDGIVHLETALRLKPNLGRVHQKLAFAFTGNPNRLPDAIAHYAAAVELEPVDSPARIRLQHALAEAHYNLGNALLRAPTGLLDAVSHYETALHLNPNFAEAHLNLGSALGRIPGRLPDAIAHFEAALRLNPALETARRNLEQAKQVHLGPGSK